MSALGGVYRVSGRCWWYPGPAVANLERNGEAVCRCNSLAAIIKESNEASGRFLMMTAEPGEAARFAWVDAEQLRAPLECAP